MNKRELELYVHIPFCARKCAYCDFLSFPAPERAHREYAEKLKEEIEIQSAGFREYEAVSVFIGGGTPSVLPGDRAADIVDSLKAHFSIRPDAEITIEINPGTVTGEKLGFYREAGINRLSLGLQSADDRELKYLGRIHTYDQFLGSYQRARMAGFSNINVDLMSGIPGQTLESLKSTIKKVTMLKPEHISAYSLIVEEGTPYYERFGKKADSAPAAGPLPALPGLPDEDTERKMYALTNRLLGEAGYLRYEISNYSRPGFECRHNKGYWTGAEYLGLGLGASSMTGGIRFHNESDLGRYLNACFTDPVQFKKLLRQDAQQLTVTARIEEFMFLGLRLTEGVSPLEFAARFGRSLRETYGPALEKLTSQGLLEEEEGRIKLTERGIDVSNYVLSEFLLD